MPKNPEREREQKTFSKKDANMQDMQTQKEKNKEKGKFTV